MLMNTGTYTSPARYTTEKDNTDWTRNEHDSIPQSNYTAAALFAQHIIMYDKS